MSSSIGQNSTFSCQQCVMKYCYGWLNLDIISLGYVTVIATQWVYNPQKDLQGMADNVGLTFSVGDTIPQFYS